MSIRRRGPRAWEVTIDLGHERTGRRLRRFFTVEGTKKDAQRAEREARYKIETGTDIHPSRLTVGELLERWMTEYARTNVRVSTQRRYASIVKRLTHHLGHVRLQALRPDAVQRLYATLLTDEGLTALTVCHHHRVLHQALRWATRLQLVGTNAAAAATPPRPERHEVRALEPASLDQLLAAIPEGQFRRLVQVTIGTGVRLSEALAWRWSDWSGSQLRVERAVTRHPGIGLVFQPPKTAAGRRAIHLPQATVDVLRAQRLAQVAQRLGAGPGWTDLDLIFPNERGGIWSPNTVSRTFTAAAQQAGFVGFTFHGLRHSHATLLLRAGVDAKLAASRLGHASPVVTQLVYQHVQPDLEVRVARLLDGLLASG